MTLSLDKRFKELESRLELLEKDALTVERGRISRDKQPSFDKNLDDLTGHLERLEKRLSGVGKVEAGFRTEVENENCK